MLTSNPANWQLTTDKELLSQLAIAAALSQDWTQAAKINQKILQSEKSDVDAMNRLAYAHTCMGNKVKAQKVYRQVLDIDPYNTIAAKNLDKVTKMNGSVTVGSSNGQTAHMSDIFLFEPGKTKIINLLNLAPPSVLAGLNCADQVSILPKNHSVSITTQDGTYLGALPDDLAHRLITFVKEGNKYEAYVKYATTKTLTVFIRETERSEKFSNQPSFADKKNPYLDERSYPAD